MSEINANKIDKATGSTLTVGDSGTTVNIAGTAGTGFPTPTSGIAASAIDSGTIATARLGSGTASSSTFLRGDQTYAAAGEDNTPYFSARGSSTQTASNNANTTLQFNTLVDSLDSASGYNTSSYDYTVQSGGAGLWYLRAGFYFSGASSFSEGNQVQIQLAKNNADFMSANVFYGGQTDGWLYTHSLAKLAVGNTLKVITYQNTGGNITLYLNNYHNSIFAGFRVKAI